MAAEPAHPLERERELDEVIAAYLEAAEHGLAPNRHDWLARYPHLADELEAFLADQEQFDSLVAPLRPASGLYPISHAITEAPTTPHLTARAAPAGARQFGDYELLEELARGGMGVVYRARQRSLNRIVALKMILTGQFASPADVQRFRLEAEAAANLDHPNIVPIYEVGEHDGQHYFSMKLIEGGSLAAWNAACGTRDAAFQRQAARLVATVAQAVHYAHQRGILHRDLKPANILLSFRREPKVTAQGAVAFGSPRNAVVPHVTDFGLAKRVGDGRTAPAISAAPLTQTGLAVGTPSYMAPEQAFGPARALTTAADVYSLGAILYELLTGRPPFQASSAFDTLLEVMEREPAAPRSLNPQVDRDLETVCRKCLEKDPARRYPTAQALADDLERYLNHEPILARPVGLGERCWRGCRRKPIVAALSAALVLAVVVGFVLVAWQWRQAAHNFREAEAQRAQAEANFTEAETQRRKAEANFREAEHQRHQAETNLQKAETNLAEAERQRQRAEESFRLAHKAVNDFWVRVGDRDLRQVPGMEPVRKALLTEVLKYYQAFLQQRGNDPALKAELAATHFRIAAITSEVGEKQEALAAYEKARALYDEVHRERPASINLANVAADLARTLNRIGILQEALGISEALASYERSRALFEELGRAQPKDRLIRSDLAAVCCNLGILHRGCGQLDKALAFHEENVALLEKLVQDYPKDADLQRQLASGYHNSGSLYVALGRRPEALELYQKAHDILTKLTDAQPNNLQYVQALAHNCRLIGSEQCADGRREEGLRTLRQGHALLERLTRLSPNVTHFQSDLAASFRQIGHALRDTGQTDEALDSYQQSRAILEKLVKINPTFFDFQNDLAKSHFDIGGVQARLGQKQEALRAYRQAADIREQLVTVHSKNIGLRRELADTLGNLAIVLTDLNRPEEAGAALCQAITHQRFVYEQVPHVAANAQDLRRRHAHLAEVQQRIEQRAQTLRGLEQKVAELHKALDADPGSVPLLSDLAAGYRKIGQFQREGHKLEEALAAYRRVQEVQERLVLQEPDVPRYRQELASSHFNQAMILAALNRREQESEAYQRARAIREKLLQTHPDLLDNRSDLATTLNNWALTLWALGRRDEALVHLQRAIELQREALTKAPQSLHYRRGLSVHYAALADLQRQRGRAAEAVAATTERAKLWPNNGGELFRAACELALAAEVVGKGKAELSPAEREEHDRYTAMAVELLRQAVASGYRDGQRLQTESALAPLRQRDDFQKLLAELKKQ